MTLLAIILLPVAIVISAAGQANPKRRRRW